MKKQNRILQGVVIALLVASCGSPPPPPPAPTPPPAPQNAATSCTPMSGFTPVQTAGGNRPSYAGSLVATSPINGRVSGSNSVEAYLFYLRAPMAGNSTEQIVGNVGLRVQELTGRNLQTGEIPVVCLTAPTATPGQIQISTGRIQMVLSGPYPILNIQSGQTQQQGSVEVQIGYACPAYVTQQGRISGCVDVRSYGYPGGFMSFYAQ